MQLIKLSEAIGARKRIPAKFLDASDGITEEPSLTPTISVAKNGGAFAAGAGTVGSNNNAGQRGSYWYEPTAGELDTLGVLEVIFDNGAARSFYALIQVVAFDPYDASPDAHVVSIADNAVTANAIAVGAITAAKIADAAITSAKIADGAVAAAKIADGALTAAKLAGDVFTGIADGILARAYEGADTVRDFLRLGAAYMFGAATAPTGDGSYAFRDAANSKNRLAGTVTTGARTVTVKDGT